MTYIDDNYEGGIETQPPPPPSKPIPRIPAGSIPGLLGYIGALARGGAPDPGAAPAAPAGPTGPGIWASLLGALARGGAPGPAAAGPAAPSVAGMWGPPAGSPAPQLPPGLNVPQGLFDMPGRGMPTALPPQQPPPQPPQQQGGPDTVPLPQPRPNPPNPLTANAAAGPALSITPPAAAPPPPQQQQGAPPGLPGLLGGFLRNAGGFFDANRNTLMALGAGLAGAPSLGVGLGRGLQGASRVQPMDIQLTRANQTSQWLQSRGYEPAVANQVANDPQLMNQILPYIMGIKPPVHVVTTDAFGEQHVRWYDPMTGRELPRPNGGTPGELDPGSMGGPGTGPLPPGVTQENLRDIDPTTGRRENLLRTYSPMAQSWISGLADHRLDPMQAGLKQKGMLAAAVADYDPNYKAELYGLIKGTEAKFDTGPEAQKVRAFNSAIQHMETLRQLTPALGGTNYPLINRLKNLWVSQTGGTAPGSFDAVKQIAGAEINGMIVAGGGGEGERDALRKSLDAAKTPEQLLDVLNHYQELGGAQLRSLEQQFESGTYGKRPGAFAASLLPESKAYLDKVKQQSANFSIGGGGGGGPGGGGGGGGAVPTPEAIAALKQNPALRDQFDAKYGAGAAAKVLGQ